MRSSILLPLKPPFGFMGPSVPPFQIVSVYKINDQFVIIHKNLYVNSSRVLVYILNTFVYMVTRLLSLFIQCSNWSKQCPIVRIYSSMENCID